jgi:hypothetical protein
MGFGTDDYILLGEVRAAPGNTRAEAVANFLKVWFETEETVRRRGCTLDISLGFTPISPEKHAEVLRYMGSKSVAQCKNIYDGVDLLKLSDAVIEGGQILGQKVSTGLHIHFSATNQVVREFETVSQEYEDIEIPLILAGKSSTASMRMSQKIGEKKVTKEKITATASSITKPVIHYIVEAMDKEVLSQYPLEEQLKYRLPGFYELKAHGFEYRSLPFNAATLKDLYWIVDRAFTFLEEIEV